MLKYIKIIAAVFFLVAVLTDYASADEGNAYEKILTCLETGSFEKAEGLSRNFLKEYPKSRFVPDVHLAIAESEKNPDDAIKKYSKIIRIYKYFNRNDFAQYRICEILYLKSDWPLLIKQARKGLDTYKKSRYTFDYRLFLTLAHAYSESLDQAIIDLGQTLDQFTCAS